MKQSEYLKAWDAEYRKQGRLWTGKQTDVPEVGAGAMVLELGCGDGKTLSALARKDLLLHGIDISPAALMIARKALERDKKAAQLVQGDVTALPFDDGSFDAIVAFHILDHVYEEDREAAADEVLRTLAPGGKAYFRGFSKGDLRAKKGELVEDSTVMRGNGILYHYFEEPEVKALFSGFEAIKIGSRKWKMGGKEALTRTFILGEFVKPL